MMNTLYPVQGLIETLDKFKHAEHHSKHDQTYRILQHHKTRVRKLF